MTGHHFTIFDTAIGRCGIVWSERGITSVQLPMGDEKKTRARLQQRDHPNGREHERKQAPPQRPRCRSLDGLRHSRGTT